MDENYIVHAFDFDGTITQKDTFIEFIKYCNGSIKFLCGMFLNIHYIIGMYLNLIETQTAKEKVFSSFFKCMEIEKFNAKCLAFATEKKSLLKKKAIDYIKAIDQKDKIMVVTASIQNYVICFFNDYNIIIEGTMVEIDDSGRLTGKFIGKNCKGKEKLNRIYKHFNNRNEYVLMSYGDSSGDKEMLDEADVPHYKPFRD